MNKQYYEALTFEQWTTDADCPAVPATLHYHDDVEIYLLPVEGIVISEKDLRHELFNAFLEGNKNPTANEAAQYINSIISKYKDNGK